jgi:Do/DeqQ family serine protease
MRTPRLLLPLLALLGASAVTVGQSQAQDPQDTHPTPALLAEPTRHVPGDVVAMRSSFAPVVKRAAPAVVNVYSRRVVTERVNPFFAQFGAGVPGMTRERTLQSLGSGVVVRADGVIVTNNHVVDGGQEFMVVLSDRREFPAKLLLADPRTDLAVLKIEVGNERLPVLAIDDRTDQQVGDLVLALGNPFGVGQTVTNGIISALNRSADPSGGQGSTYIQTDAAINPGNSGGALVDMDGNLIGINSFIVSGSGSSSGVGFAIPAAMVRRVVETAAGGAHTLVRPWLGAKTDPVTGDIAKSLGLGAPVGALVSDIYPSGPGARAGVRIGDVIVGLDGAAVSDPANLNYLVATKRPGEDAKVELLRDGKRLVVDARVEPPPATPAKDEQLLAGDTPLAGVTVVNLSPAVADEVGADPFLKGGGVLISNVAARGYAAAAGFRPGDIVRDVNGQDVGSVSQLRQLLSAGAKGMWSVTIQRGAQVITARFRA